MATLLPGRPFWTAFTVFCSNLAALLTVSALNLNWLAIDSEVITAVVISLLVAGVTYGEIKLTYFNGA